MKNINFKLGLVAIAVTVFHSAHLLLLPAIQQ